MQTEQLNFSVTINGVERQFEQCLTLLELLKLLKLIKASEPFAVAVNGHFVPRSECDSLQLSGGDKIEVLSPIQGG